MNKDLLTEGAVAGHMNHIYDNGELTFGKLKEMLQAAVNGDLRGTEKTDGQNIFLSFNIREQKAKAVRNKTQIKAGGLSVRDLDDFFSNHPSQALRHSFVEGLRAFEKVVKNIDKKTQSKIFGPNNEVYYNTEIMNPGNPGLKDDDPRGMGTTNVIPYDKKTLLIHDVGHKMFNVETAMPLAVDISKNFELLKQALSGAGSEDATIFSIETHQERSLHPEGTEKARSLLPEVFSELDNLLSPLGLDDSDTINNFVVAQIGMAIDEFDLDDDTKDVILRKVMGLCTKADGSGGLLPCGDKRVLDDGSVERLTIPNPNINKITKNLKQEAAMAIRDFTSTFKYGEYVRDLQLSLYDFSVAILQGFKSSFISDNEKQINFLKQEVQKSIDKINSSSNLDAKKGLQLELEKLKNIENINTPSEGFVFDFEGFTYKFTGAFGPANQILGMERYERYGKIEQLKIGVLAGAFKPPHIGHFNLLKGLFSDPQTSVDIAYLAISNPVAVFEKGPKAGQKKAARFIPVTSDDPEVSDIEVTSDNALQIWSTYIDRSEFKDRIKIVKTEHASPVHFVSDFVSSDVNKQQSIPQEMVPPPGSKVFLAVSSKGNDAKRFGSIISNDNTRRDISVVNSIAEPVQHSATYLNNLRDPNFSEVTQGLPNLQNNPHQFHASDMRYLIGAAKNSTAALELLKDFVPDPKGGDASAVLSIFFSEWGERAMDDHGPIEEPEDVITLQNDQEPEEISLDDIETEQDVYEVVSRFSEWLLGEGNSKFQRKMKKRLKKSHTFYLDQGRKDLIKYGKPYSLQRVKSRSNAFLAESLDSKIEEFSGAGNVAGSAVRKTKKIKEEEKNMNTKSEKILRLSIRKALKKFFEQKKKENEKNINEILEEHKLRISLRDMIMEQAAENPSTDPSDNTGINTLKDLLKGTNVLATLRNVYKTLTTDQLQKKSFRAHIVRWIQDTLTPVKLNDVGPSDDSQLAEQVDIDIEGIDTSSKLEDKPKFIDALDGSEKEEKPEEEEEEEEFVSISGADKTGRNKAERVYPTIEKSLISYYGELDNPEDMEMFYDYLVANVKLYFDKWDGEMNYAGEEPTNDEYEKAKQMA